MGKNRCAAIILAAGQGKRMGTKIQKQYLELNGKPVLYYSLAVFEKSTLIDEIILVVGADQEAYCRREIVDKYGFRKIKQIVEGGAERYHSVYHGLCSVNKEMDYVFIHDGARPFVNEEMLERAYEMVCVEEACVVGMPVKDTIKIVNERQRVESTPDRATLWAIQTPQVFLADLLLKAYGKLMKQNWIQVTDDAMVVEKMLNHEVQVFTGKYENIKITTPEDLVIAKAFLDK